MFHFPFAPIMLLRTGHLLTLFKLFLVILAFSQYLTFTCENESQAKWRVQDTPESEEDYS